MEIIHLILGKANPERMNGVNKVVYQLATRQAASGRKVKVWGITKNLEHNYGKRNFKTQLFPAGSIPFYIHPTLKAAIVKKKGKAIFHLHGGWVPVYATLSQFFKKHNIDFVITPHGAYNTVAMQRNRWIKKAYFNLFEKNLLNRAMRVHSIGESELDGLNSIYPNDKSFLLPYGFTSKNTPCKYLGSKQFIIGYVGRLDIYTKGLDLLIKAFKEFQKQYPDSRLWIVGDSDERQDLANMIEKQNLDNVILWGSRYGEEKDELMRRMHVFVHPSRNEGLPSSVLEAASMGIPCIVSKATNVGKFINTYHAGISIENENTELLTEAFMTLKKKQVSGRLTKISNNAQAMVKEIFNWNTLIEKFDQLYQV